ncbi:hypothetical protein R1flu_023832 [Riccia fluitans]|uniref:Uncharacterized protein n=1 Tax=Riccia fluitans TaxID=41844 RepID=A0ABD1XT58_9MARC
MVSLRGSPAYRWISRWGRILEDEEKRLTVSRHKEWARTVDRKIGIRRCKPPARREGLLDTRHSLAGLVLEDYSQHPSRILVGCRENMGSKEFV